MEPKEKRKSEEMKSISKLSVLSIVSEFGEVWRKELHETTKFILKNSKNANYNLALGTDRMSLKSL